MRLKQFCSEEYHAAREDIAMTYPCQEQISVRDPLEIDWIIDLLSCRLEHYGIQVEKHGWAELDLGQRLNRLEGAVDLLEECFRSSGRISRRPKLSAVNAPAPRPVP